MLSSLNVSPGAILRGQKKILEYKAKAYSSGCVRQDSLDSDCALVVLAVNPVYFYFTLLYFTYHIRLVDKMLMFEIKVLLELSS